MRGGKVSAVNNSSNAANNTSYAIKLTDGEFNMTSGMVQAEDGGYEGNSMTALSVQDGKADLSGGSIESNAQGIHMGGRLRLYRRQRRVKSRQRSGRVGE